MDFHNFISSINTIRQTIERITISGSTHSHKATLDSFSTMINKLLNFFDDDQNIKALSEYDQRPDINKNDCPLDILCKDLLEKLIAVERLLNPNVFDHLIPDLQQKSNDYRQHNIPNVQHSTPALSSLLGAIQVLFDSNLLSAFETLKYLSGHNRTLIILGANGSGKTSFANYLKRVETHVKVIPANKPIMVYGHYQTHYNSTFESVNNELFGNNASLSQELLLKLIISLCCQHDDCARRFNDGKPKTKSTYDKVKEIFDSFFDVELDNSAFSYRQIKGKKSFGEPYEFNKMSDGERVAFFYIATVIVAPPQSFIVVDEPENHLNPAIYNKIWDRLMEVRDDCQFIFISHTMEFINARSDYELVKIKSFTYPDKFEFEFLGGTLENLNSDFIVEVVGSRKPILFCEGSKNDYDYKVYEILFGTSYTVIPTGNCASVESSVVACNIHATTYSIQTAVGIVDSDLKSESEVERLKQKKIYALKCNEIEMLLLDEAVFKKALVRVFKPESEFDNFRLSFFTKLHERKQHIIKRLVKTQIDENLKNSVIDDRTNKTPEELEANLSKIVGEIDVSDLWKRCNEKITDIINREDYDSALKFCCLEHNEVIGGIGKKFVNDYSTIALGVLKDDESLSTAIKEKYFADFDL